MRTSVAILFFVIAMIQATFCAAQENDDLKHNWKQERGNGEIRFISKYPAPIPFSITGEPEAIIIMNSEKLSPVKDSLSKIINFEIQEIRKGTQIDEYLEDDGHKPDKGITTYIEEINGTKVGFIKYRGAGVIGKPPVMPRTAIHGIFIKNDHIYFVHLIVLFAGHQEEVRADQLTIIKGLIGTL